MRAALKEAQNVTRKILKFCVDKQKGKRRMRVPLEETQAVLRSSTCSLKIRYKTICVGTREDECHNEPKIHISIFN